MKKLKKQIQSIPSKNPHQITESVEPPKILRGCNPKILTLRDHNDPVQQKCNDELISSKWDKLRNRKDYKADYKKYFGKVLFVFGSLSKKNQTALTYFKEEYGVLTPINPKYPFPNILKKCKTRWEGLQLESAFLSLLIKPEIFGLITPLAPVLRHYLTDNKIAVRKNEKGQFEYESLQGSKLPNVDLSRTDIRDVTICINLEASETDIKRAVNDKINLYRDWFETVGHKGTRNRPYIKISEPDIPRKVSYLEYYNFVISLQKNHSDGIVWHRTAGEFFPKKLSKNPEYARRKAKRCFYSAKQYLILDK